MWVGSPMPDEGDWMPVGESLVGTADPRMPLPHVLDVNAVIEDGPAGSRLVANWTWASELLSDHDANDIADSWFRALTALATHAAHPGAGGYSPSDLIVSLTQDEIAEIEEGMSDLGDL